MPPRPHGHIAICLTDLTKSFFHHRKLHRTAFYPRRQMRRIRIFVQVGTHLLQRLCNPGIFLHVQRIPRNQRAVLPSLIAAHGRLIVSGMFPALPKLLNDQTGHICLSHIGSCACDKKIFAHTAPFPLILSNTGFTRTVNMAASTHRQISPGTASTKQYRNSGPSAMGVSIT